MEHSSRKGYDEALLALDTLLARMGQATAQAVGNALDALATGDTALAGTVIARDSEIDAVEHEIEHRCLTLFLRQQPVAGDLRKVSTAMKIVTDIERMADYASDIAEIVCHLDAAAPQDPGLMADLDRMGREALAMEKQAVAAYVQVDLDAAARVVAQDDEVDAQFCAISRKIAARIAETPAQAGAALDLFMVAKYLERLGDHAVNVAEWVGFLKTGVYKARKIV